MNPAHHRWSTADLAKLRYWYPAENTRVVAQKLGRTYTAVKAKATVLGLEKANRIQFTPADRALLRKLYPDTSAQDIAARTGWPVTTIYAAANRYGLKKSAAYLASPGAHRLDGTVGWRHRFPKGHVPANKGLRRPGYAPGRMRDTQFKKGQFPFNHDPDFYVIGALRVSSEGYIELRTSFGAGANGWSQLHRVLWIDAHGPVPKGHIVTFKDREKLNVCIENLELITRADICRRNSIHNLPVPLRKSIQLLGALKRTIKRRTRDEKQNRRPA